MSAQHTPGPWAAECAGDNAYFLYHNDDQELHETSHGSNARLIAAAPELLEALYAIDDGCDNLRPGHVAYKSKADLRSIAKRAITKALGEQS